MTQKPIHPGEHLAEELKELGISAAEFARQIDVPTSTRRRSRSKRPVGSSQNGTNTAGMI